MCYLLLPIHRKSSNKDLFPLRKVRTFGLESVKGYNSTKLFHSRFNFNTIISLTVYISCTRPKICIVKNHEEYKDRLYKLYLVFVSVPTVVCNVVTFKKSFFLLHEKTTVNGLE
jgi:hypothetical protein